MVLKVFSKVLYHPVRLSWSQFTKRYCPVVSVYTFFFISETNLSLHSNSISASSHDTLESRVHIDMPKFRLFLLVHRHPSWFRIVFCAFFTTFIFSSEIWQLFLVKLIAVIIRSFMMDGYKSQISNCIYVYPFFFILLNNSIALAVFCRWLKPKAFLVCLHALSVMFLLIIPFSFFDGLSSRYCRFFG